jgi:PAS domain S-box-containing protein
MMGAALAGGTNRLLLLESERDLLGKIAAGVPLAEVLDGLLLAVEARSEVEMQASILLRDQQGTRLVHGAAPSLPAAFNAAVDGIEIGPTAGSCGAAAFRGEAVFVANIASDPFWADWRHIALAHGLHACWSAPITAADGRILGTLAFYFREPLEPTERDVETISLVAHTAAILIEQHHSRQAQHESQKQLAYALNAAGLIGTWDWHIQSNTLYCDARLAEALQLDPIRFERGDRLSEFPPAVHPDDVERIRAAISHTIATGERCSQEFRLARKDGGQRWVIASGECHYDKDRKPARFAGAVVDINSRKHAEEALREQAHRFETIDRLSRALSSDQDLERIMQTVTDIATELSGAKFGAFFYNVSENQAEQYSLFTLSGAPREAFANLGLPRNTAIFEHTFRGLGVVRADDIRADPRYGKNAPYSGMPKGHLPVVSYLAVPVLSSSGQVYGGLFFGHHKRGAFTKDSEKIVCGIAAHASIAIDNARLFQNAQKEIDERRRADKENRRLTQRAHQESEARLQEALLAGRVIAFEWDPATGLSQRSANTSQILGVDADQLDGAGFLRRIHPDDRANFKAQVHSVTPDNPYFSVAFRFIRPDGREAWLEETAKAEFDPTGRYVRLKGLTRDITGRKNAERALNERNLQLALAGRAALVGSYSYDVESDTMQISEGYAAVHGLPEGTTETTRSQWRARVFPADSCRVEQVRRDAFRDKRREYGIEYRIVRPDGETRWIEYRSFISYHSDGRPQRVVGVNIDATERKQVEEQRNVLNAELDHRVKNVLATVAAIITQSQNAGASMTDFTSGLQRRISSLASTHELLSRSHWHGVPLEEIVRRELAPYAADNTDIYGPAATLKAEAAQPMAMVLHELATNAAKYGAFSTKEGRVSVRWFWLTREEQHDRLVVEWQEIGGPPVREPRQSGYGTSIIRELLPHEIEGTVDLTFAPEGMRCRLEVPAVWIIGDRRTSDDRS